MPQLTIYLDLETDKLVRDSARATGEPTSRWIADAIRRRARSEWPPNVLRMFGTLADFPAQEELRKGYGKDARREAL